MFAPKKSAQVQYPLFCWRDMEMEMEEFLKNNPPPKRFAIWIKDHHSDGEWKFADTLSDTCGMTHRKNHYMIYDCADRTRPRFVGGFSSGRIA